MTGLVWKILKMEYASKSIYKKFVTIIKLFFLYFLSSAIVLFGVANMLYYVD